MNLLLFEPHELDDAGRATLEGRRAEHLRKVLRVEPGDRVRAGVVDAAGVADDSRAGARGTARVESIEPGRAVVVFEREEGEREEGEGDERPIDASPPVDLVVGMPRPQVLHRVLQTAAVMGVRRLDLVNAWRVEKSFFQSPSATPERIRRELLLGAEQGLRTRLPEVALHARLVPFVEGLDDEPGGALKLVAHPSVDRSIESLVGDPDLARPARLAIGPEGGWIDREVETFERAGFRTVDLGPWILRVEFAVAASLAQLELLRRLSAAEAARGAC